MGWAWCWFQGLKIGLLLWISTSGFTCRWWQQFLRKPWIYFWPDQPYSTDLGRQQEEDLHQEAAFHVRLRTIGHRLPTHSAAAGDYCGPSHHRATAGLHLSSVERARLDLSVRLQLVSFQVIFDYPSIREVHLICNLNTLGVVAPLGYNGLLILSCTFYAFKVLWPSLYLRILWRDPMPHLCYYILPVFFTDSKCSS